ncbi:hypothetical protein DFH09DRAFT_1164739 [Mycena vulgaris]|nr:hypothetical protein DFH09DRAFT_1164739 [Mycena vulgaris]
MFLLAEKNSLTAGFSFALPPTSEQPHPFALHDVNDMDWNQFLEDMREAAKMTPQDKVTAYCLPILAGELISGLTIAGVIIHHIRRKKLRLVNLLVDKWNHHFFHPRNMEVILMRGQTKLSGQSDQAVANLYTPRTINFTPPPVEDQKSDGKPASQRDRDKTYRLFVVSMES